MTSTIGTKKIQHPNGTNAVTIDTSGDATFDGNMDVNGNVALRDKLQVSPGTATYNGGGSDFGSGVSSVEIYRETSSKAGLLIASETGVGHTWLPYTDGTNYITSTGSGGHRLRHYSGSSYDDRVIITSQGYVTMLQQPRFLAYNNGSDFAVSSSAKITCFSTTNINVGSHYNTSNQRLTAPVAGCYYFGAHFRMGAPGKVRVFRAEMKKNGSYITDLAQFGGANDYDGSTGYDHPGCVGSVIVDLAANDYIELHTSSELDSSSTLYIQNGQRSRFFGYLLY